MKKALWFFMIAIMASPAFSNGDNDKKTDKKSVFLETRGIISNQRDRIKDANIKLFEGNREIQVIKSHKKGEFSIQLKKNAYYTLVVEKDGFISKKISISTMAPDDVTEVAPYECTIELFEEDLLHGVMDVSVLDFPTALIKYNSTTKKFEHDREYTRKMIIEQNKLIYESYLNNVLSEE